MAAQRVILLIPVLVLLAQLWITEVRAANGNWGAWLEWEPCSASCGDGERRRMRFCNNPPPRNGGAPCAGRSLQYQECEAPMGCPVDGEWSEWSAWMPCSVTCGEGVKTRQRSCDSPPPANGGRNCEGSSVQRTRCASEEDCPRDGGWSEWSKWSPCSVTCGGGSSFRYRECNSPPPSENGKDCLGRTQETRACRAKRECAVNGHWSLWTEWSACSVTCGVGVRQRWRKCDNPPPQNGGAECSAMEAGLLQELSCNGSEPFCRVDGGWSDWGEWGDCVNPNCASKDGIAYTIRQRSCNSPYPAHTGSMCQGPFLHAGICALPVNCPVDGGWGEWTEWKCSRDFVTRKRNCDRPPPSNGGKDCQGEKVETYTQDENEFGRICPHMLLENEEDEEGEIEIEGNEDGADADGAKGEDNKGENNDYDYDEDEEYDYDN